MYITVTNGPSQGKPLSEFEAGEYGVLTEVEGTDLVKPGTPFVIRKMALPYQEKIDVVVYLTPSNMWDYASIGYLGRPLVPGETISITG